MNNKKTLGCLGLIIGFLLLIYLFGWWFAPGSYPKAERYEFNIPEDSLIAIIKEVKKEHPEINLTKKVSLTNGKSFSLQEGRRDENDHWYSIYFFYPDKNEIIKTWTRPIDQSSTSFAFVSINSGLTLGNWRTINNSFWWWKNEPDKQEFEQRILNKIKTKLNY